MKKFFLFRSSTDKQVSAENPSNGLLSNQRKIRDERVSESLQTSPCKSQRYTSENQCQVPSARLRRSRSFSSAAFLGDAGAQKNFFCMSDQSSSPSSSGSSVNAQQHIHSSRVRTLTPERHAKVKRVPRAPVESDHVGQKRHSSRTYLDHSGNSSRSSSNLSNEVLDLYIDGEQHHEKSSPMSKTSLKGHTKIGRGTKPPRSQCTAPASPTGSVLDMLDYVRPHSSRGGKGSEPYPSARDCTGTGLGRESPKELAKHVVEKLCQNQTHHRIHSRDYDPDVPITIEDVYGGSLNRDATSKLDSGYLKDFAFDRTRTSTNGYQNEVYLYSADNSSVDFCKNTEDQMDVELESRYKDAKNRVLLLSEELEQESYLHDVDFNVPALVRRIKDLTEEKISLALEVSGALESQLADRASLKEQLRSSRLELESRTQRLQKETNEIQSTMEKELDRRSNDWSLKVEKFQAEEQRLRERVRELAEQNVSLQREVSSFNDLETERRNLDCQVKDLTVMLEATQGENQDLHQGICELQDKYKGADEDRICIQRNYGEKEEECRDLHACVSRLLRTCSEQEKTIDGLRGELAELVHRKHPMENSERHVQRLQLEQMRLTAIELALRREIDSYKTEVTFLRHENVNLLNRLKSFGDGSGSLTCKLDEEIWGRLDLLQKEGVLLLNESTNLCSKLLQSFKRLSRDIGKEGVEVSRSCIDTQFIIESDVKVQGFRRGTERLMRSLHNISTAQCEKSDLFVVKSETKGKDSHADGLLNGLNLQDFTKSQLKAEALVTSLLRDKLHAKDQEVEQLQAEVAAAARGNDILRCEAQNAVDSLSAMNHRMKELEVQMIKKEEKIRQLENDLQENTKELSMIRGILPKVTEERDMMWEEVKQHSEKNMLLNSEVNMLKKKIDSLDEDILLKEGEITILRDTLGSKSFDLLASPDHSHNFLLE